MKYIIIILLMSAICSCQSVKYVPVERIRHDSIYITNHQRDSIYQRDSVYVVVKGDTIYMYKDRFVFRDKKVRDTTYINRTDTFTQVVEVEKSLTRWQALKLKLGGYVLGLCVLLIAYVLFRLFRK